MRSLFCTPRRILTATSILLAAMALSSCSSKPEQPEQTAVTPDQPAVTKVDKPFAGAGKVEIQLESGNYTVRAAPDEHIRVSFAGNTGDATATLAVTGTHANLTIRNTPHSNFRALIELPSPSDLTLQLSGGNLEVAGITGNKDIDSKAGNVGISVPNANDYSSVDASVMAGNLKGGPFGDSASGFSPHLKWTGPGKYTLRARLAAGNLELKH